MRLTERDVRLVRDAALSHVLSRDNTIRLGYFGSASRANNRLKRLADAGYLARLATPYFAQFLYAAGPKAPEIVGERIAALLRNRRPSPMFVQHALALTEVRAFLQEKGAKAWRFEQQLWCAFDWAGVRHEVRPDGLAMTAVGAVAVEADMGNVSVKRVVAKLLAYVAFAESGGCQRHWGLESFDLLVVTDGASRASRLEALVPADAPFGFAVKTFADLGIRVEGGWS